MDVLNPWHILSIVSTGLIGVLTWLGLKQISRIEALEKEKASQVYVATEISELKEVMREARHAAANRDMSITSRLDNLLGLMIKH